MSREPHFTPCDPTGFTPAALRAFESAARWVAAAHGTADGGAVALLLGLLEQPECHAARWLVEQGIDAGAVRERWPAEQPAEPDDAARPSAADLARQWSAAVDEARGRLADHPDLEAAATEHLLLGLACRGGPVGQWLHERALGVDVLVERIHRRLGIETGPLAIDWEALAPAGADTPPAPVTRSAPQLPLVGTHAADQAAWRMFDAAANRAGEGLRLVEDYARFALDDAHLTARLKQLRHDLAAVVRQTPVRARLTARDTPGDVGTSLTTAAERVRAGLADLAAANLKRAQQALRTLEETAKLWNPAWAAELEQLRYESYALERAVLLAADSRARLAEARVYVLVDGRPTAEDFERLVTQLVAAGADLVQLRDKSLDDRTLLDRAGRLRRLTRGTRTLAILNDRADLAAAVGADGVHVGQEELTVRAARAVVGPEALVGVSTHSIEQARRAVLDGADYLGVGPTFPSRTKSFAEFPGLALVGEVAREISLPAFAIGGLGPENAADVVAAGLRRVAVSGAVVDATDPGAVIRTLRAILEPAGSPT